jgi:hypothetical protein
VGGVAFLVVYGALRFRAALRRGARRCGRAGGAAPLGKVLATCLVLTWANPHVYLDTVVLLGSISAQYAPHQAGLWLAAAAGSLSVLHGAGLWRAAAGAGLCQGRGLGGAGGGSVGCTMWAIAAKLAFASPFVLRPGLRELSLGHLSQLGATVFFSMSYIIAKRLSREAPASVIVAVLSVTVTLGLLPLAVMQWQPVRWEQAAWLAAVAALATLGHYAMARAFRAAPLAVTQPVTFLQLIWAALLGALAFGEPVEAWVMAGGALIILAISANTWVEARRERAGPAVVEEP